MKRTAFPLACALLLSTAAIVRLHAENPPENKVPAARIKLLDHGINMCNLLHEKNKFNSFAPEDLKKLKDMGIANLRIPVEIGYILPGIKNPTQDNPTQQDCDRALATLDTFIENAAKAGFPVTLSLFMKDQSAKLPVDESKALMLKAMDILSARYAKKYTPDQMFFDVNEPYYDADVWNALAVQVVETVRKNAPDHTILIEPCHSETNFIEKLTPVKDQSIIYAMHIYFPTDFTLQGQPGMGKVDASLRFPAAPKKTEEKLEAWMKKGIDWAAANKVPLIMNEFGCSNAADAPSRLTWIKTVRTLAEKYDLPWSYWSFSGKLFGLKPSLTSDYDAALLDALSGEKSKIPAPK